MGAAFKLAFLAWWVDELHDAILNTADELGLPCLCKFCIKETLQCDL